MKTKDLYFRAIDYNRANIIEKLADIIVDNGGIVQIQKDTVQIHNRSFYEQMEENQAKIDRIDTQLASPQYTEKLKEKFIKHKADLVYKNAELQKKHDSYPIIKSRFVSSYGLSVWFISFILDKTYYHFEFADNPFFPDIYAKIPLNDNNTYYGNYYRNELKDNQRTYMYNQLWDVEIDEEIIEKAAKNIYDILINADYCEKCENEKEKIKVPNTYNDGYHTETRIIPNNKPITIKFNHFITSSKHK